MNIIICGAGRVGFTIAKQLSEQGHSITVIDPSSEDIQKIDDALDVKAIVGKATYPTILEKANANETDMIIAVTRNDEINMVICQIAFSIFNIPKKIEPAELKPPKNHKPTVVAIPNKAESARAPIKSDIFFSLIILVYYSTFLRDVLLITALHNLPSFFKLMFVTTSSPSIHLVSMQ